MKTMHVKLASEFLTVPGWGFMERVYVNQLPWAEATDLIDAALDEQAKRRGRARQQVSPMEVALCAAFLYYDMLPASQYPIGAFDTDFAFPLERLMVEVDGRDFHGTERDKIRDSIMQQNGWKVVRVQARHVYQDALLCARLIDGYLAALRSAA